MERLEASYERNLWELYYSISKRNACYELEKNYMGFSERCFFDIAVRSLKNDFIAHEIKILDRPKTASFFYLYNCDKSLIDNYLLEKGLRYEDIEMLAAKLRIVRNKTHMHIDKKYVIDSSQAWKEADIDEQKNALIINRLYDVLTCVYNKKYIKRAELPGWHAPYSGVGIKDMLNVLREASPERGY